MQLKIGKIYVTRGGLVTLPNSDPVPWGYDRVKLVEISDDYLIVETPWTTQCQLARNYPLEETIETEIRQEFKLVNNYLECETIPFREAVERGICKEKRQPEKPDPSDSEALKQALIDYFSTPYSIAAAANYFGVKYQKVRYILRQIVAKGYGNNKYTMKPVKKADGSDAVQLVKE